MAELLKIYRNAWTGRAYRVREGDAGVPHVLC
jgi:hypothetical protein